MSESEFDGRSNHGRESVGSVPESDSKGLLRSSVPRHRHHREQRQAGRLKQTEEESEGEQRLVAVEKEKVERAIVSDWV